MARPVSKKPNLAQHVQHLFRLRAGLLLSSYSTEEVTRAIENIDSLITILLKMTEEQELKKSA